jgi:hypothetical protein
LSESDNDLSGTDSFLGEIGETNRLEENDLEHIKEVINFGVVDDILQ